MKTLIISVLVSLLSINVFALNPEKEKGAKSEMLSEMIHNSNLEKWHAYKTAAEFAINWNSDLELAKEWIDYL